jgi:hypothetical protein
VNLEAALAGNRCWPALESLSAAATGGIEMLRISFFSR